MIEKEKRTQKVAEDESEKERAKRKEQRKSRETDTHSGRKERSVEDKAEVGTAGSCISEKERTRYTLTPEHIYLHGDVISIG